MSNGSTAWNYTYDADGLRTQRTNGSTTYNYVYYDGLLQKMTVGGHTLRFRYGADGRPYSVQFDGTDYFYVLNAQGDVVSIQDKNGVSVAAYTYDAWGRVLTTTGSMASTLGQVNPLRYRGYVYDQETGLYYLQSRYYNPEWGRFINADGYATTGQGMLGSNMFAYCLNNPVRYNDKDGEAADSYAGMAGEAISVFFYELFTGNSHPSRQTEAMEQGVRQQQLDMIEKGAKAAWNAYVLSVELEAQVQYEKHMEVITVTEFLMDNPLIAVDVVAGTVGTGLSYVGAAAVVAGVSIPVVGQVVMGVVGTACGLWGIYRLYEQIYENIENNK